jgi:purine nucleosidase
MGACGKRPELATDSEHAYVRVALGEELRGQTFVDRRETTPPANVTLVRRAVGFKDSFFDTLEST